MLELPTDEVPVLRASAPADLLAVVPYLLGFHPTESLVLLALRERRVALAARVDLPDAHPAAQRAVAEQVVASVCSVGPDAVAVLAYAADPDGAVDALDAVLDAVTDLPVVEALLTDGHRWWSRLCNEECCPPEGTPYAVAEHPMAAAAVLAGLGVLPDRAAVAAMVVGPADETEPAERAAEVAVALDEASLRDRRRRVRKLARKPLGRLTDAERVELAVLVADRIVRDDAWALIERVSADRQLAVWRAVVAVAPAELAPGPLCLLAVAAWLDGQGALMVCAFERALELDPGYRMARLLADLNDRAVPPTVWEDVLVPLRTELAAYGRGSRPG